MDRRAPQGLGPRGTALLARMATVLDPLASRYGGRPAASIKPALARAWQDEFDVELSEPVLTRCAQSIHDHTPWTEALWPDGWSRPDSGRRHRGRPREV